MLALLSIAAGAGHVSVAGWLELDASTPQHVCSFAVQS